MKFRHHTPSWRFSRKLGRGIASSVPDNQLGTCFVAAIILATIAGSPIIAIIVLGTIIAILPSLVSLAVIVAVGVGLIFVVKNHYSQIILSWFFLKENEPDGTVLPLVEIKNRVQEFLDL